MIKRFIFNKKKNKPNKFIIVIIVLSFLFFFFYLYQNIDSKFILIPEFKGNFYKIPKDKGGKKILNTDKKSLNAQDSQIHYNHDINLKELFYSIQFFTDEDYNVVNNILNNFINNNESIFKKEDFFILTFFSEVGVEYFLIYKNFKTREKAYDYCSKYLSNLEKCLIVDVQKFKIKK